MKRRFSLFALLLLFLLPTAYAEDMHVPGSATRSLFTQAYHQGDFILMDMRFSLKANENAAVSESAPAAQAIGDVLENAVFSAGIGKMENGVRLLLAAGYTAQEQQVVLDLTAEVTRDGLAILSSLIPDERFTIRWETLLALSGLSDAEIAQILSLRDLDWHTALSQLLAQTEAALSVLGQIAAPYGETIMAHAAALPVQVRADVPEENGFPAAAKEVCFILTQKATGDLATALANQLEQDTMLCAILDAALAENGEALTTAQLCQSIRDAAADMTDEESPIFIYIGMDETDNPIFLSIEGSAARLSIAVSPYDGAEGFSLLTCDLLTLASDYSPLNGISLAVLFSDAYSAHDPSVMQLYLDVFSGETAVVSLELAQNTGPFETEEGLQGVGGQYAMVFSCADGEAPAAISLSAETSSSETASGGEQSAAVGSMEISAGGVQIPMTFEAYSLTDAGQDGPRANFSSFYSAPLLGIDEYMESYTLYTAAYAPSAGTEIALETASEQELQALSTRAMDALESSLTALFDLLPASFMDLIAQQAAPAQPQ